MDGVADWMVSLVKAWKRHLLMKYWKPHFSDTATFSDWLMLGSEIIPSNWSKMWKIKYYMAAYSPCLHIEMTRLILSVDQVDIRNHQLHSMQN